MDRIFVVDGRSLSCKSFSTEKTIESVVKETPLFSNVPLTIGPYTLQTNGQICRSSLEGLLNEFPIVRKNRKFFDLSSTAIFHCSQPLTTLLEKILPEDVGLYVNLGPANAQLDDFTAWANENMPDDDSPFTSMMASSVVKILPNVVMSNLSMNLPIKGENTVSAGTAVTSVQMLKTAIRSLRQNRAQAAVVCSASFPCDYFNIDAYKRYFDDSFFTPPLAEGASSVLLTNNRNLIQKASSNIRQADSPADSLNPTNRRICGEITGVETGRIPQESSIDDVLSRVNLHVQNYDCILCQPNTSGNLLSATEPTGIIAVLNALQDRIVSENLSRPARGLSIARDWFGNFSVVELEKNPEK